MKFLRLWLGSILFLIWWFGWGWRESDKAWQGFVRAAVERSGKPTINTVSTVGKRGNEERS